MSRSVQISQFDHIMRFPGSDVVPVKLAATWVLRDCVGQASRRYRRLQLAAREDHPSRKFVDRAFSFAKETFQ
jgi:hypothetical protein